MSSLFQEYMDLFTKVEDMQSDELLELKANVDLLKEQLNGLTAEIEKLKRDSDGRNSPYIRKIIAEEAQKIEAGYRSKLSELAMEKKRITEEESAHREALLSAVKMDYDTEMALKTAYRVITEDGKPFDISWIDDSTGLRAPVESIQKLKARANVFEKHCKDFSALEESLCKRIAETVSMKEVFSGINNPKVAVGCMTAYLLVTTIAALYLPVVAMTAYLGITALSVKDALSIKDAKSTIEKELWLLKKSYDSIEAMCQRDFQERVEEANQKANEDYQKAIGSTAEKEKEIRKEYEQLIADLRTMENDPDFIANKLSIFIKKLKNMERQREDYVDEYNDAKEEYDDFASELNDCIEKLKSLRKRIEDKYCGPLVPGTSRLLPSNLFLGFESNGDLKLFEYNLASTLIIYSGSIASASNLCMSVFLEFLRETNMTALRIYIMDTELGAPAFAPFTQKELSEAVTICTTKDSCMKALSDTHTEMEARGRDILSQYSDINQFNAEMIKKNSLTREYILLFVLNSGGAIYNNERFNLMLKSGSAYGIIPFVFMSAEEYNNYLNGNGNNIEQAYNLLQSIRTSWFTYIDKKDSLIKHDKGYIDSNLKRILINSDKK